MTKLYSLLFISYVLLLALKSDDGFPSQMDHGNFFPYIIDKPFTEDGFYMLTIAWNIAEGDGIKYTLNRPTTGTQPLVTFIQAGIAKTIMMFDGDKIDFLRMMIIFSSGLLLLFALVCSKIIKKLLPGYTPDVFLLFPVLFSFDFFAYFNNGLETGFYLIMIAVCVYYSFYFFENPGYKQSIIIGILSGLAALTRIDFVLPVFVFLLSFFYYKKIKISKMIMALSVAGILLLPWLVYMYGVSGSIFPASASRQIALSASSDFADRLYDIVLAFLQHLTPFFYSNNFYFCLILAIVNGVIFYFLLKKYKFFRELNNDRLNIFIAWGFSFLILTLIYLLFSTNTYFYSRYTTPLYLFIFIIAVTAIIFFLGKVPVLKKFFVPALVILFFVQAYHYHLSGRLSNPLSMRIAFIKDNLVNEEKIGMGQSGVTGFFINNIVNLDGKVDHVISLYAENNNTEGFLDSMNVNVLLEWDDSFNPAFRKNYLEKYWEVFRQDIGDGRTACYIRLK
jgi:hypothetical protein